MAENDKCYNIFYISNRYNSKLRERWGVGSRGYDKDQRINLGEQKGNVSFKHELKQNCRDKIHDGVFALNKMTELEYKNILFNQISVPSPQLQISGDIW